MDDVRIVLPETKADRLHILAAVSGGADSVAMLALLRDASERGLLQLTAAHFEHGIRNEASLADAAFVRALCAEWGIRLIEGSADVPAEAKRRAVGLEEAARDARYAFLRQAMRKVGAEYIALAHHLDDQAETVLMHLFRGSGLRGTIGMKAVEGVLYRPLLGVRKENLVGYLQKKGIPWREDQTNTVPDNPRNALRLKVLPQIEQIYPGVRKALVRFSQIASDEDAYMEEQAALFEEEHVVKLPGMWLIEPDSTGGMWRERRAILRRTIHRLTGLSFDAVTAVIDLWSQAEGGRAIDAGGGWRAERGSRGLYLIRVDRRQAEALPLNGCGEVVIPNGMGRVRMEPGHGLPIIDDPFRQEMDAEALADAVIRTRRNGDVIHPLGAPGRQKLSDYLINRKVDRPLRDVLPLLARGNEILWVMGEGISERVKLKKNSQAVQLEWMGSPIQKFGGKSNA